MKSVTVSLEAVKGQGKLYISTQTSKPSHNAFEYEMDISNQRSTLTILSKYQ